ncbi:MAG: hypothetical protein ACK5MD_06545 [Flavobacteriales bacterium]
MIHLNKRIISSIALIVMFLFSVKAEAQLGARRLKKDEAGPKGQILLYGSFNYIKTKTPTGSSYSAGTSGSAEIPIGVGYFINNNDVIGVNYAHAHHVVDDNTTYRQNEAGLFYSPSITLGKYFALIGQVDAHYVWGKGPLASGIMDTFTGYRLRAYPLVAVFLGGGWALKFKFAELSLLQTKNDDGWTKSTIAGINASTFGVGLSKNFNFHKKG